MYTFFLDQAHCRKNGIINIPLTGACSTDVFVSGDVSVCGIGSDVGGAGFVGIAESCGEGIRGGVVARDGVVVILEGDVVEVGPNVDLIVGCAFLGAIMSSKFFPGYISILRQILNKHITQCPHCKKKK